MTFGGAFVAHAVTATRTEPSSMTCPGHDLSGRQMNLRAPGSTRRLTSPDAADTFAKPMDTPLVSTSNVMMPGSSSKS